MILAEYVFGNKGLFVVMAVIVGVIVGDGMCMS